MDIMDIIEQNFSKRERKDDHWPFNFNLSIQICGLKKNVYFCFF